MPIFLNRRLKKNFNKKILLLSAVCSLTTACSIGINSSHDDDETNDVMRQENIDPIARVESRLTDSEQKKFTSDDGEEVPVVLEGNGTSDTLKAYLTQAFYQVEKRGEYAMDEDGVVAEAEMAMDTASVSFKPKASAPTNGGSNDGASTSSQSTPSGEFSGTNVQVEGVDEGDIWKYDGRNFYVLSKAKYDYSSFDAYSNGGEPVETVEPSSEEEELTEESSDESRSEDDTTDNDVLHASEPDIADDKDMMVCPGACRQPKMINAKLRIVTNEKETLSTTDLGELKADEVYLTDKRIALVGNQSSSGGDWGYYGHWRQGQLMVNTYNISDKKAPVKELSVKIDGHKVRSRRIGNDLYLVSRFTPQIDKIHYYPYQKKQLEENKAIIESMSVDELLPSITVNETKNLLVQPEQCWLTVMPKDNWGSPTLTVVTKLSLETGKYESTCIGGPVEGIYMSQNALYLYNTSYMTYKQSPEMTDAIVWSWSGGNTHIHKFNLDGLAYKGSQLVDGKVGYQHASFRFGELNDGSLGIITSSNDWQKPEHRLTVLGDDESRLSVKAILPNKAKPAAIGKPGEQIYSVRFMQDRAYIVTFQKTDPLYVLDLSTPADPKIAGELEIPGFSDYLHPVGKNQLLGIGKDAATDERNTTYHLGVKVSLFDVSDISKPLEVASKVIGHRGSHTELAHNHLAFTGIQMEDSYRFAFPITVHDGINDNAYNKDKVSAWHDWSHTGLYLFEVKDSTLSNPGVVVTEEKTYEKRYSEFYGEKRGLIQGEHVFHLCDDKLYKSQWSNASAAEGPF